MDNLANNEINEFHAHLYYNQSTLEVAKSIIKDAQRTGFFQVGKMHEKPLGPHPTWSCQLMFNSNQLNDVIPWLLMNRKKLTWFIHGLSGNNYIDHTNYVMWIGKKYELNLNIFTKD